MNCSLLKQQLVSRCFKRELLYFFIRIKIGAAAVSKVCKKIMEINHDKVCVMPLWYKTPSFAYANQKE